MENIEKKIEIEEVDPLGVLLNLLNKEKLEISNFSLAQVADQYLNYLNKFKDQTKILENISEFLWVASKLALLKSKILLATFEFEEEEAEGDDLRARLIEYQKFKEISKKIKIQLENRRELLSRENKNFAIRDFSIQFDKNDLARVFKQAVGVFNIDNQILYQKKELWEVVKIEEKIKYIEKLLDKSKKLKFSSLVFQNSNRLEVVVSFLSVLELVKQGIILVRQEGSFQEIDIIRKPD